MLRRAGHLVAGSWSGRTGLALVTLMVLIALLGPVLAPHSPTAIFSEAGSLAAPSSSHLLGTDTLGRDVLSRFLHGGRSLILLSALTTAVAVGIGTLWGLTSGYLRGAFDIVGTRLSDVLLSLPPLLLVMLLVMSLGSSSVVLVTVIAVFFAPRIMRIMRGATQTVCAEDFVTAARARGESTMSVIGREILPNVTGPLLIEVGMRFAYVIIFLSTLNFLGLGAQPPSSDWGLMVSDGRVVMGQAPLLTLVPALGIAAVAVGASLVSDEVASHLGRTRGQRVQL
jgi:peptide/nickel transport system permease protein